MTTTHHVLIAWTNRRHIFRSVNLPSFINVRFRLKMPDSIAKALFSILNSFGLCFYHSTHIHLIADFLIASPATCITGHSVIKLRSEPQLSSLSHSRLQAHFPKDQLSLNVSQYRPEWGCQPTTNLFSPATHSHREGTLLSRYLHFCLSETWSCGC